MKRILPARIALLGLFTSLALFSVFHALVLLGVLPYTIVWGGKMEAPSQMQLMEAVSLGITLLLLTIVAVKAGFIPLKLPVLAFKITFWAMFVLFLLNTLGNLASVNDFERWVFPPITLLMAIFSLRIAIEQP